MGQADFGGVLVVLGALLSPLVVAAQTAPQQPLSAGGLVPPGQGSGPAPAPPATSPAGETTVSRLDEAGQRDSGRGLDFVYVEAEGGFQLAALGALHQSGELLPAGANLTALGPELGLGAGLRLLFLTVGPRFRWAHFGSYDLWTLNLDVGWHVPLGRLEPYAFAGAGYARLGHGTDDALGSDRTVSISGFDVRLGGGVDYYVTNAFSVGGGLSAELIRLSRDGIVLKTSDPPAASVFASDASTLGLNVTANAVLGLHL